MVSFSVFLYKFEWPNEISCFNLFGNVLTFFHKSTITTLYRKKTCLNSPHQQALKPVSLEIIITEREITAALTLRGLINLFSVPPQIDPFIRSRHQTTLPRQTIINSFYGVAPPPLKPKTRSNFTTSPPPFQKAHQRALSSPNSIADETTPIYR